MKFLSGSLFSETCVLYHLNVNNKCYPEHGDIP